MDGMLLQLSGERVVSPGQRTGPLTSSIVVVEASDPFT
jgi:hypothetical protein